MTKSKFFRDPLHLQIRFESVDLSAACPDDSIDSRISWALQKIIDTEAFQRLRHIRQNGLANMVFHGAEHSRFSHSMGVSHLARRMYSKLCLNSSINENDDKKLQVAIAALVHDLGHGPFSHTMEEILKKNNVPFHHESMTLRFINDEESEVNSILKSIDNNLPYKISKFFDKKIDGREDDFIYKIVSSQMDADRLDYVQRDALFCGIRGHGFDLERLLDLIFVLDHRNIAVHRNGIEAVEGYLVTLDQMWRAVYYHQAVRSCSVIVTSLFKRAFRLFTDGDQTIFPTDGKDHPMSLLFKEGKNISLETYLRLSDATAWDLINRWRNNDDMVLKDLSNRIAKRNLLKSVTLDSLSINKTQEIITKAKELTKKQMPDIDQVDEYYVVIDDPTRTSYNKYDWKPEGPNNSIWLTGGESGKDCPIEDSDESGLIGALKNPRHFERLFVTSEVRKLLLK